MNVLLIVLDTARRDAFEPYGAPPGATPATAQLAARGVAIPQAHATSNWTLPSHVSIFTGRLPREAGLAQPPDGSPQSARPLLERDADRMLGVVLRRAGFSTEAWSTNVWASPGAGFDLGFDRFAYVSSGRDERMNALLGGGRRAQLAWALEGVRSRSDDGAEAVGRQLRASIGRWSGQPAFWFVNLCECHSPYLPPRPWNDLPATERIQAALEVRQYLNFEAICRHAAGDLEVPAAATERMRHLYARAIAYMDNWLAGVLEALDARGILEETLVIITSDHGENFGEEGLIAHGFALNPALTHVPLVMAGPGAGRPDAVVSLADLPGLIAAAAGIERHPFGAGAGGIAIAQSDPMAGADDPRIVRFVEKFGIGAAGVETLCARLTSATDGAIKLLIRDGREQIFDVVADPEETTAIDSAGLGGRLPALRAALARPGVQESTASPAPVGEPPAATPEELAAIERQMKLLGYM